MNRLIVGSGIRANLLGLNGELMGCGQKAAAMEDEERYYEDRMAGLKKVKPESWDSFLDEVQRLLEAIESSKIMAIARASTVVEDHLKQIRRVR